MALVLKDRVKETTTTTGTGTYTLGGAVTGFQSFTSVLSNADTTYYCCTDGTNFEVGLGTFTSSGTTLARTTVLESSNSNNAVNWTSGTRDIFITQPAEKAAFLDASDVLETTGGVVSVKNGGTQSEVRLYCESSNAHYAGLKAPAHADFAGNVTSTLPSVTGVLIGTANADAPATTTSSSDADHVLVNDNGVLKKITPSNLGIGGGGGGSNADTVDNKHVSVLTQAAYDALTPDSNTIYFISG